MAEAAALKTALGDYASDFDEDTSEYIVGFLSDSDNYETFEDLSDVVAPLLEEILGAESSVAACRQIFDEVSFVRGFLTHVISPLTTLCCSY